jgi:hypothetical protein
MDQEVFDGCLLGDGYLCCYNPASDISYPYFKKKNKFYDHVLLVHRSLFGTDKDSRIREEYGKDKNGRPLSYPYFCTRSLAKKELLKEFKRWYPVESSFEKRVPSDIRLTPTVLLHWFLDDGNSFHRRKMSKTNQIVITMCTECFPKENQEILRERLLSDLGLLSRFHRTQFGLGWRIEIPQSQASKFFDIIGPPPVPSLAYKWK